jgi:hypothetical protein
MPPTYFQITDTSQPYMYVNYVICSHQKMLQTFEKPSQILEEESALPACGEMWASSHHQNIQHAREPRKFMYEAAWFIHSQKREIATPAWAFITHQILRQRCTSKLTIASKATPLLNSTQQVGPWHCPNQTTVPSTSFEVPIRSPQVPIHAVPTPCHMARLSTR